MDNIKSLEALIAGLRDYFYNNERPRQTFRGRKRKRNLTGVSISYAPLELHQGLSTPRIPDVLNTRKLRSRKVDCHIQRQRRERGEKILLPPTALGGYDI